MRELSAHYSFYNTSLLNNAGISRKSRLNCISRKFYLPKPKVHSQMVGSRCTYTHIVPTDFFEKLISGVGLEKFGKFNKRGDACSILESTHHFAWGCSTNHDRRLIANSKFLYLKLDVTLVISHIVVILQIHSEYLVWKIRLYNCLLDIYLESNPELVNI